MKKFLVGLLIFANIGFIVEAGFLSKENQRLKSKVADANLAFDLAKATVEQANKATSEARKTVVDTLSTIQRAGERIDQLQAELRHSSVTSVNEKQGAHTFVYVESDSWVDLSNGEQVPEMRKIAPVVDVDPMPGIRWKSPQLQRDAGTITWGTGGWNQ